MTAHDFFEHFATLADAPGGVPKLRELILQLAIQGKLVPQDAREEPIQPYLDEIREKRNALVICGKAKKLEDDPLSSNGLRPFPLPESWAWVRLGEITQKLGAGSTPLGGKAVYLSEGIKFLRSQNVWNRGLNLEGVAFISREIHDDMAGTVVAPGDILLNITGASIGRCALVPEDFDEANVSQHVSIVRLVVRSVRLFVHACIISSYFQDTIMRVQVGVSREGLSMSRLQHILIPLPPLAEQKRIVAKVDRLMALCDALEAQQQARHAVRSRLHATLLGNLQTAANAADFVHAWQRLRDHFAELFTPGEAALDAVAQLRQTILQLAVQGKLVAQDADDEPVSQFISKIGAVKSELSNGRRQGQIEPMLPLKEGERPFAIPPSWAWKRFGEVTICRDGERIPIESGIRQTRRGDFDYYGASGVIDKIDDYLFDKALLLIGEDGANLVNRSTPIAFIASGKYWVNNHAHVLDSISLDALRYLEVFINAIDLKRYLTGTAQPKMNQAKMNSIPVAVPPENEQQRIVAKVQQLMAQCDALEASLKEAATVSERWSAAAVRQLLDGTASPVPVR